MKLGHLLLRTTRCIHFLLGSINDAQPLLAFRPWKNSKKGKHQTGNSETKLITLFWNPEDLMWPTYFKKVLEYKSSGSCWVLRGSWASSGLNNEIGRKLTSLWVILMNNRCLLGRTQLKEKSKSSSASSSSLMTTAQQWHKFADKWQATFEALLSFHCHFLTSKQIIQFPSCSMSECRLGLINIPAFSWSLSSINCSCVFLCRPTYVCLSYPKVTAHWFPSLTIIMLRVTPNKRRRELFELSKKAKIQWKTSQLSSINILWRQPESLAS